MSFKRDGDDQSWLKALQRRRVSELFAVNIPEDEAFLMKNGRFACLVCSHRPVFDTISSLAVHRGGRKHTACAEQFLSKKAELNDLLLKRQHEIYSSSSHLPVSSQQSNAASHKLLGARLYDARAKRPKLRRTDRRPTVNIGVASDEETAADADSCDKPLQTIAEIRRMRNQKAHVADHVVKPYIGKRSRLPFDAEKDDIDCTGDTFQQTTVASTMISTHSITPTLSTAGSNFSSPEIAKCSDRNRNCDSKESVAQSSDTNCVSRDKIAQYLKAVESGWKRSRDGSWIKDENAEFDSDEDAPNDL